MSYLSERIGNLEHEQRQRKARSSLVPAPLLGISACGTQSTPITDKHAFHRITGVASADGDVVGVQVARDLECQLNTQKELTECADKNLYDLVALLSGKTPETYNARVKEIADGFLQRMAAMPNEKALPRRGDAGGAQSKETT